MKKRSIAVALAITLATSLTACGTKSSDNTKDNTNESQNSFKVSMVTDTGGVNDQSFNQSAWEGLTKLSEDYGVKTSYIESVQESDYASNLDKMVDNGNDLIWGIGFAISEAVATAAEMNPDRSYAIVDHAYENTLPNVTGVVFRGQEGGFLAGYIAGRTTKTDKVGFVGGIANDILEQFEYGYRAGVAYAADELGKDIEVVVQYAESFGDAAKGKAIATSMYSNGCDVIFHAAGNAGTGVIEAAKEINKWVIGVDRDQSYLAPDNVLTSVIKRVDNAIYKVTQEKMNGTEIGGQTLVYGCAEEAIGLAPYHTNLDKDVYDAAMEIQQQIVDGTIVPPYNAETFDAFMK